MSAINTAGPPDLDNQETRQGDSERGPPSAVRVFVSCRLPHTELPSDTADLDGHQRPWRRSANPQVVQAYTSTANQAAPLPRRLPPFRSNLYTDSRPHLSRYHCVVQRILIRLYGSADPSRATSDGPAP